jgi:hypothetical protein
VIHKILILCVVYFLHLLLLRTKDHLLIAYLHQLRGQIEQLSDLHPGWVGTSAPDDVDNCGHSRQWDIPSREIDNDSKGMCGTIGPPQDFPIQKKRVPLHNIQ